MGMNSFPQVRSVPIAQKFNRVTFYQGGAAQNTIYTVLNITSGQGVLNNLNFSNVASMTATDLILTVDGVVTTTVGLDTVGQPSYVPTTPSDTNKPYTMFLNPNIPFYSSLKIEIRNTGTANNLGCVAQYNLV